MSANNGNIRKEVEEIGVYKPQFEDFKVFFADDMTHIKAMLSDGSIIPFFSGAGIDESIYANDGQITDPVRVVDLDSKILVFDNIMGLWLDVASQAGHAGGRSPRLGFEAWTWMPISFM